MVLWSKQLLFYLHQDGSLVYITFFPQFMYLFTEADRPVSKPMSFLLYTKESLVNFSRHS